MCISQDFYDRLPEIMPDALVVINNEGRIVQTNILAEQLFGYANGELIGQRAKILIPERFWTKHIDHYAGYLTDLRRRFLEEGLQLYGLRKDGSEFLIDISLNPIKTQTGTFVISTIRDISAHNRTKEMFTASHETLQQRLQKRTAELVANDRKLQVEISERKHSEEDLQATQASLKLAVHAANIGLWDWNLHTNQIYLSPEWKHQLGYEDHEIENSFEAWECRLHPDDHDRMLATVDAYIKRPWPNYEVEFRLKAKDGSYRWILTHASLMQDAEGKPYRMLGSHIDITERKRSEQALRQSHETLEQQVQERTAELSAINEQLRAEIADRKRAEEALRESEQRFQDLYDNAPDMYFTVLEDGTVRSVNLFAAEYLGISQNDLIGRPVWSIVHPDDLTRIRHQVREIFELGKTKSELEFRKVRKDGSVIWIHEQARLITGTGSVPTELRIICRDISKRKQTEEALQKAKEEAEQANATKSRFLAAVSHDLRQPLQTLSLLIGVLKGTDNSEGPVREVINNLEKTMNFMDHLLDTLLDINRLDSGFRPYVTEFSVARLFNRMEIRFEHQAKQKGLEFHVIPCRSIVRSDEVLLERIVQNLLSNAICHTTAGKVLLGCRRRGSNLHIEIWDTGPGIPEEQRSMIFQDYYQLNNPARDRHKGLGLGLAIVDRGARLLGHRVEVRSTVGKGSVFSIEVPFGRR